MDVEVDGKGTEMEEVREWCFDRGGCCCSGVDVDEEVVEEDCLCIRIGAGRRVEISSSPTIPSQGLLSSLSFAGELSGL